MNIKPTDKTSPTPVANPNVSAMATITSVSNTGDEVLTGWASLHQWERETQAAAALFPVPQDATKDGIIIPWLPKSALPFPCLVPAVRLSTALVKKPEPPPTPVRVREPTKSLTIIEAKDEIPIPDYHPQAGQPLNEMSPQKRAVINDVSRDYNAYWCLEDPALKDDFDVVKAAAYDIGLGYRALMHKWKHNLDIAVTAASHPDGVYYAFKNMPSELRHHPLVVERAMQANPKIYELLALPYRQYRRYALMVLKYDFDLHIYIPEDLKLDPDIDRIIATERSEAMSRFIQQENKNK